MIGFLLLPIAGILGYLWRVSRDAQYCACDDLDPDDWFTE